MAQVYHLLLSASVKAFFLPDLVLLGRNLLQPLQIKLHIETIPLFA